MTLSIEALSPYIHYKTSRSGGSGGQHVNKVATKVELLLDLDAVPVFSEEEKQRIRQRLQARFQSEGLLQVISQQSRSQLANKEQAQVKLLELLTKSLQVQKKRKPTKPGRAAKEARLEIKRRQALRKINRRKDWD